MTELKQTPLNYCHCTEHLLSCVCGVLYSLTLQVQSLHLILQGQK